MLKAAAEAYFFVNPAPKIQSAFNELITRAIKFSPRRNEIAHGVVSPYDDGQGHTGKFVLEASLYATNKRRLNPIAHTEYIPTYEYSSREIDAFREEFTTLWREGGHLIDLLHAERVSEET